MTTANLRNLYKKARSSRRSATGAISLARAWQSAGKTVYDPSWAWARGEKLSRTNEANEKLALKGRARFNLNCAWIERPESIGLRFVGYSDEILSHLRHTGWYADDFQDEKYRGAVWQLPARRGQSRYIAGFEANSTWFLIQIETITDSDDDEAKKQAARDGDWLAEKFAEREREYCEVAAAKMRVDNISEEISEMRKKIITYCGAARANLRALGRSNIYHEILRESVTTKLDDLRELREEKQKIIDDYSNSPFWATCL